MTALAFKGNILFADGVIREGLLEVTGNKIQTVQPETKVASATVKTIDLPKDYVISPGFIDLQINGGFGHDLTLNPELVEEVARGWLKFGVTSFLATIITCSYENMVRAIGHVKTAMAWESKLRSNILGIHFEGPYINPSKSGAHNKQFIRNPEMSEIELFDPSIVKLITLAPELPGCLEFIKALVSKGILVGIGHSQATYEVALEAIKQGASWGTHIFNAMPALTHREPGIVGALLTNNRVKVGLIVDGIHVHPAICKLVVMTKKARGISLVSDAISAAGMPPGQYSLGDQKIIVDQCSSRLEDGRLAGSILSLDQAVRNLVSFQASTLADALLMASTIPAEILNLGTKGKIQQGFDADLVVLDEDLNVAMTIVNGEITYQRESDWIKL